MRQRRRQFAAIALVLSALSCGDIAPGVDSKGFTVQILSVAPGPKLLQCRGGGVKEIYFNIRMVNTTADTLWIDNVSSNGYVKESSNPSVVGQTALVFSKLPFKDEPRPLRSHDGDVTFTAIMTTLCVSIGAIQSGSMAIDVQLYVRAHSRTNVFEYAAPTVTLQQAYQ